MSRFADVAVVRDVDLGACLCPGTPHESDWAKVRGELATPEIARVAAAQDAAAVAAAFADFVVEWNLLGPDGTPWPPTAENILLLKPPTLQPLVGAHADVAEASSALPNASAAPSQGSSRGSGSRTRTNPTRR